MNLTQEDIIRSGYKLQAAPVDAWRIYNENDPIPGYFEFDWLSSRHPDLYHQFALSTVGLMEKLHALIDLTGCDVIDIGAGTGRSAAGAAKKANRVFAVELYTSVVSFGINQLQQNKTKNVFYINGDREHLPVPENSVDVAINAWAELNLEEAYRVLRPRGYLILLGAIPNALCGELTSELVSDYAWLPKECAPAEVFEPEYPDACFTADNSIWNGIRVAGPIHIHEFTYVADYQDYSIVADMTGRLYGPKAKHYFMTRRQSTFSWRLQIIKGQVSK
ncbi:MAG: class I SAM-dependent methyltransferase [Deltaproteobacteria bacterium]|nr:class I SAM-dependent methyltransferase [Deltaproteobacteria bacterium]